MRTFDHLGNYFETDDSEELITGMERLLRELAVQKFLEFPGLR